MRENRLSGLMRGGKQTVIGLGPLNPSLPAYSTETPQTRRTDPFKTCQCFPKWLGSIRPFGPFVPLR